MSTTTTHLGLVKPELTDSADITAMNPNWEKIDELLSDALLKSATIISGNANLNNFSDIGLYTYSASAASTISNVPENAQGTLLVLPRLVNDDPQNIIQIVISRENGFYLRNKFDGTWNTWNKVASDSQLTYIKTLKSDAQTQINDLNNAKMNLKPGYIELAPNTTAEHGGYIDFHYNGSTSDYTSRIMEDKSGQLHILAGKLRLSGVLDISDGDAGLYGDDHTVNMVTKSDVTNDYKRSVQLMNKAYEADVADSLILIDKDSSGSRNYKIYGEHNKPSGSYSGNGNSTYRSINTGGIGSLCMISGYGHTVMLGKFGGFCVKANATTGSNVTTINYLDSYFDKGVIHLETTIEALNRSGETYTWEVI